jgi:hypothetical protein
MQGKGKTRQELFRKPGNLGHDAIRCRARESDPKDAGCASSYLVDIGLKCRHIIDYLPSPVQEELPRRREVHPAGGAVEQLDSNLFFKLADLLRERRLGHVKALGRAAKVPLLSNRYEVVQLADVHGGAVLQLDRPWPCCRGLID